MKSYTFKFVFFIGCLLSYNYLQSQTETFSSGAFIINMGNTNPTTINDDVKPYGLVYDLVSNYQVPVKLVIGVGKVKDGVDFYYNGYGFRGGTLIIPSEYRSPIVNAKIATWQLQGVVGVTTTSPLTLSVTKTITYVPRWTLDGTNGQIAEEYLEAAGITSTAFPNAYNWKDPQLLDYCDDLFVLPHADPTWATHSHLWDWNLIYKGSIWAGCHAVSALENSINPANPSQQMNFLTQRGNATNPTPWPGNSLLLWTKHADGTAPYTHRLFDDPVAQYMGVTDLAHKNGSEQIFIPKQQTPIRWNPGVKIIAYDPTQVDVPNLNPTLQNAAAVIVYGRAFDNPSRGHVMYQGGHSNITGTVNDGAAIRAFLNFSFFLIESKAPVANVNWNLSVGQYVNSGASFPVSVTAASTVPGTLTSYKWICNCGGTFANDTAASTIFTAPTTVPNNTPCILSCEVSDNCGRKSFQNLPIVVMPPPSAPTLNNDIGNISNNCGANAYFIMDVLANDTVNTLPITFTSLNQASANPNNAGIWSSDSSGLVTFVPTVGYSGPASITYTVTNSANLSNTATITINVGSIDGHGCFSNEFWSMENADFLTVEHVINNIGAVAAMTNGSTADPRLDFNENLFSSTSNTVGNYVDLGVLTSNYLTFDLPTILNAGDTVEIYWAKKSNSGTTVLTIIESLNNSFSGAGTNYTLSGTGLQPTTTRHPITLNGTQYLRLKVGPGTNQNLYIDALKYQHYACLSKKPNPQNDNVIVLEDAPVAINVLQNDTDPKGLPLTVNEVTVMPTKGKISINTDNTISYLSNLDQNGIDSFTYVVYNSEGFASKAVVHITILPDGCAAGMYTPNPPSGQITKIFEYGLSGTNAALANSTLSNFSDGYIDQANPNNNYGVNTTLEVGKTFSSTQARRSSFFFNTSEIPVNAMIQSAVFSAKRVGGDGNTQILNVHALNNNWTENGLTWIRRNSTPTNWLMQGGDYNTSPTASASVTSANTFNSWDISALAQNWVANPASNFGIILKTDELLNKRHQFASKENGTIANRPKLTITYVTPTACVAIPNRAPMANPDFVAVRNGHSIVISPLTNDFDPDMGNTITITGVSGITAGSVTFTANTITYTANVSLVLPRTERLTYTITDNNGSTDIAYIFIDISNSEPSINSDFVSTLSNTAVTVNIMANDFEPEGGLMTPPVITSNPYYGVANIVGNSLHYTPATGFTGNDTLIYEVCETVAGTCTTSPYCDTARVIITVINQSPVAVSDNYNQLPCVANSIQLIANDTDAEGNDLTVNILSALSPNIGTLVDNHDGTVTFTPNAGASGNTSFSYSVTDNGNPPATSAPATVTITLTNPINTSPIAIDDTISTNMDETLYANVLNNDTDPENNQLSLPFITVFPTHGTAIVLGNGLIQYIPNPGYFGSDNLTYQICDTINNPATCSPSQGLCDVAVLQIYIQVPNSTIAINDQNATFINTTVSGNVLSNDFDLEGDSISLNGFLDGTGTAIQTGLITVSGVDVLGNFVAVAGSFNVNPDGSYNFTPANNFTGVITLLYTINDDNNNTATDTASLQIVVNGNVGNTIIANNDENLTYGSPVSGNVATNDNDPQGNLINLTGFQYDANGDGTVDASAILGTAVVIGGQTSTGLPVTNAGTLVLNANGTYTFTPAPDFHGIAEVVYTICDNGTPTACQSTTLTINVLSDINGGLNDPPFAGDDFTTTTTNTSVIGNFISNDTDPNGNSLFLNGTPINPSAPIVAIGSPVTTTQGGTVQFFSNGTYSYTPPLNFTGTDNVNYTICDSSTLIPQQLCSTASLQFEVGNLTLVGNVYNDINAGAIDGVGTNTISTNTLFVNLVNPVTGLIIACVPVSSAGFYAFDNVGINTNYHIVLTNVLGTVGTLVSSTALVGAVNTAEGLTAAGDGTPNGVISVSVGTHSITGVNFGVNETPIANSTTIPSQINPGGNVSVTIPPNSFGGTDFSGGLITSLLISNFPVDVNSITINGISYTSSNFPSGGVFVPTDSNGVPTQVISVDPINGGANVVVSYFTIDNAGAYSSNVGSVSLNFTDISVSGTVYDDANGLTDNTVSGTGIGVLGGSQLYANLVSGGVVGSVAVNANGTYTLSGANGVQPNTSYQVVISTTQGTNGASVSTVLPANWVSTGEYLGAGAGNDGLVDGSLTINVGNGNMGNANFGIDGLPTANNVSTPPMTNPLGSITVQVPTLGGNDPEDGVLGAGSSFQITTVPTNATLYYDGVEVLPGKIINNYDPTLFTIDPLDGNQNVSFTYTAIDAAGNVGLTSSTVSMSFTYQTISGHIWDDANNSANGTFVNIYTIGENGVNAGGLFVNVLDNLGNVIAVTTVNENGYYALGIAPNSNVTLQLSQNEGLIGSPAPAIILPSDWVNTSPLLNTFNTGYLSTNDNDFGIQQIPTINNHQEPAQLNPGNNGAVSVNSASFSGLDLDGVISLYTITSFPSNTDTLIINGITYTAANFPIGGVNIQANADGSFPTNVIQINPINGNVLVQIPYTVTDNAGSTSVVGVVGLPFTTLATLSIGGTVWHDWDNSANHTFMNIFTAGEVGANPTSSLYVNVVDFSGIVVASTLVNANGTYLVEGLPQNTNLTLQLSTVQGTIGSPISIAQLPENWVSTSPLQYVGFNTGTANSTNNDFGIQQPPIASNYMLQSQNNPDGVNPLSVSGSVFIAIDRDASVIEYVISGFPTNVTSITVNGITFTAANFPIGGITIAAVNGNFPNNVLTLDPIDGAVTVQIPFYVVDNASVSSNEALVSLPFNSPTVAIHGSIWNDANASAAGTFNNIFDAGEMSLNSGGLYINILNINNVVIGSVPVSPNGDYEVIVYVNSNIRLQLSTLQGEIGSEAPNTILTPGWMNTSPQLTDVIAVYSTDIYNRDFGIQQIPTAANVLLLAQQNPGGTNTVPVPSTSFSGNDPDLAATAGINAFILTGFPSGAETMIVNGIFYTAANFPADGILIAAVNGNFPANILMVDPMDSVVKVIVPYKVIDNANTASFRIGSVTLPFVVSISPLPVTLLNFTAKWNEEDAAVSWVSTSEFNTLKFDIERSFNAIHFEKIGSLSAAGSSSVNTYYAFNDSKIRPQVKNNVFYRLKIVDLDGNSHTSNMIMLNNPQSAKESFYLLIAPNPSNTEVSITVNEDVKVTIVNELGQILYEEYKEVNNNLLNWKIPVYSWSKGVYYIHVVSEFTKKTTKLIVD